jgi:hypothetical protein
MEIRARVVICIGDVSKRIYCRCASITLVAFRARNCSGARRKNPDVSWYGAACAEVSRGTNQVEQGRCISSDRLDRVETSDFEPDILVDCKGGYIGDKHVYRGTDRRLRNAEQSARESVLAVFTNDSLFE